MHVVHESIHMSDLIFSPSGGTQKNVIISALWSIFGL